MCLSAPGSALVERTGKVFEQQGCKWSPVLEFYMFSLLRVPLAGIWDKVRNLLRVK